MTWQTSHQVQPSLLHLHRHYSNDQCQLRRQWNAGQSEMNLIAVSARLQVIASFGKNKINLDKMAPEMQRQYPQHRIRISIISPIFQFALISRSEKTTIFTMPPILKLARRRDGDVTAPELARTLTTPAADWPAIFLADLLHPLYPASGHCRFTPVRTTAPGSWHVPRAGCQVKFTKLIANNSGTAGPTGLHFGVWYMVWTMKPISRNISTRPGLAVCLFVCWG